MVVPREKWKYIFSNRGIIPHKMDTLDIFSHTLSFPEIESAIRYKFWNFPAYLVS